MIWKPIIEDKELKAKAKERLDCIYNDLVNVDNLANIGPDLYQGMMGVCLFLYYYSKINNNNDKTWMDLLIKINNNISYLNDSNINMNHSYYYTNFAWLSSHILKQNNDDLKIDLDLLLDDCDDFFLDLMEYHIQTDNFDIIRGGTQIASYFLNRFIMHDSQYLPFLNKYIDFMYSKADKFGDKFAWKGLISKGDLDKGIPKIIGYNLGLAHGMPSLVIFFHKLKKSGIVNRKLDEMFVKTCNYILSTEQELEIYKSRFSPSLLLDSKRKKMSRLGWCYGDLGIGYSLLKASEFNLHAADIREKSLNILFDTINRKEQSDTLIVDDCLCHGTAGVALIFDKLYKKTNEKVFMETALYWYQKLLEQTYENHFAGGYKIFKGYDKYESDVSFLSGISGIGLSIISAIYPIAPDWTEFLILN